MSFCFGGRGAALEERTPDVNAESREGVVGVTRSKRSGFWPLCRATAGVGGRQTGATFFGH